MTSPVLVDVPSTIVIDGKHHRVIATMANSHYRALVLGPLGTPKWLSNEEVARRTGKDTTKRTS